MCTSSPLQHCREGFFASYSVGCETPKSTSIFCGPIHAQKVDTDASAGPGPFLVPRSLSYNNKHSNACSCPTKPPSLTRKYKILHRYWSAHKGLYTDLWDVLYACQLDILCKYAKCKVKTYALKRRYERCPGSGWTPQLSNWKSRMFTVIIFLFKSPAPPLIRKIEANNLNCQGLKLCNVAEKLCSIRKLSFVVLGATKAQYTSAT